MGKKGGVADRWKKMVQFAAGPNPFDLFEDNSDTPRATEELRHLVEKFVRDVEDIRTRYFKTGITDTASTDAIINFITVSYVHKWDGRNPHQPPSAPNHR